MVNNPASLDTTFGALSDGTRRAILARLALGTLSVTELAEPFDMSLPAVSKHLRVLEDAGLIVREKEGRVHRFTLDLAPIDRATGWISEMQRFWEARLDAFAAYIERTNSAAHSRRRGRKNGKNRRK